MCSCYTLCVFQPIWFFASVAEDTATQNVTDSFLCFDLDLNAAEDTHPADVTNWGLTIDGETSASRTCEFVTTCGCTVDDDDEEEDEEEEEADDEDAVDGDAGNSAFSVITATSSGNNFALIAGSACLLAFANGVRAYISEVSPACEGWFEVGNAATVLKTRNSVA